MNKTHICVKTKCNCGRKCCLEWRNFDILNKEFFNQVNNGKSFHEAYEVIDDMRDKFK